MDDFKEELRPFVFDFILNLLKIELEIQFLKEYRFTKDNEPLDPEDRKKINTLIESEIENYTDIILSNLEQVGISSIEDISERQDLVLEAMKSFLDKINDRFTNEGEN